MLLSFFLKKFAEQLFIFSFWSLGLSFQGMAFPFPTSNSLEE